MTLCSVEGCDRPMRVRDSCLCGAHHRRMLRGKPTDTPIKTANREEVHVNTRIGTTAAALVDLFAQENRLTRYGALRVIVESWAEGKPVETPL